MIWETARPDWVKAAPQAQKAVRPPIEGSTPKEERNEGGEKARAVGLGRALVNEDDPYRHEASRRLWCATPCPPLARGLGGNRRDDPRGLWWAAHCHARAVSPRLALVRGQNEEDPCPSSLAWGQGKEGREWCATPCPPLARGLGGNRRDDPRGLGGAAHCQSYYCQAYSAPVAGRGGS